MAPADEGIDTTQEGEGLMVHDMNSEGQELMAHDVNSEGQELMTLQAFHNVFSKNIRNMQWKDTLFYKNKGWKTYYIFFLITFWTDQSTSRKHHFLNENIQNVFRTCFCRKRVSFISMFFEIT